MTITTTTHKLSHFNLRLEGIATQCAHCGMALTDAISIERSLGPQCSKKGYNEDPVDSDELEAMLCLSKYPDLVQFLNDKYKPLGLRGLMNGLVRVCALNRKSPVFADCVRAIDALGFKLLASTLRKSLATVFITGSPDNPSYVEVRVLKRAYSYQWQRDLTQSVDGLRRSRTKNALAVPIHEVGSPDTPVFNQAGVTNKRALWDNLVKYFAGEVVCTPKGNFVIG